MKTNLINKKLAKLQYCHSVAILAKHIHMLNFVNRKELQPMLSYHLDLDGFANFLMFKTEETHPDEDLNHIRKIDYYVRKIKSYVGDKEYKNVFDIIERTRKEALEHGLQPQVAFLENSQKTTD